jgi:hypothetical protein
MKKLTSSQLQYLNGGALCGPTPVQAAECIVFRCVIPGALTVARGVLTLDPASLGFSCTL